MDTNKIMIIANTPSQFRSESNVYDVNGISPTLTARDYKWPVKVLIKNATKKGYLIAEEGDGIDTAYPDSKTRRGRVQKNMAHTITTDDSKCVVIGASIGRDTKNPSDRKVGNSNLEQRLEINKNGTSNTITSVQKDNYVVEQVRRLAEKARPNVEPKAVKLQNSNMNGRRIKEQGEPMFTVTAHDRNTVS